MKAFDARARAARTAEQDGSTLDARSKELIRSVMRVLASGGCRPSDIEAEAVRASRELPASLAPPGRIAPTPMDVAAHVVTLWFHEAAYTDSRGRPRPLPVRGERSLEVLARRAAEHLDVEVEEVLRHLLRRNGLRRRGRRYLPRERALLFRGSGDAYHSRSIERAASFLRTLEHNAEPAKTTPAWYERFAGNAHFPVSKRAEFDEQARKVLDALLARFDAGMHEKAGQRERDEPTVGLEIGAYVSEYQPSAPEQRAPRRPRASPGPSRKKRSRSTKGRRRSPRDSHARL